MLMTRRAAVLAGAAALARPGRASAQTAGDITIGAETAPVSLIEYASSTCPHCAAFHRSNWATLKSRYIDTGRVRVTMREMATPPPQVAFAMFQLARCGSADANEYFRRLGILFQRQQALLQSGTMANLSAALVALGAEWGLSEGAVLASFSDQDGAARLQSSIEEAHARGVTATPTFFLNGERVRDPSFHTPEGMAAALDAAAS